MSMIEKVAELKDLAAKATPGPYEVIERVDDWEIYRPCLPIASVVQEKNAIMLVALRNAAPAMLAILGEMRLGDAEKLARAIGWIGGTNANFQIIDCVRRYQAMAAKTEAESK